MVNINIGMELPSVANIREHWAVKAKRSKMQRESTYYHLKKALGGEAIKKKGMVITLTRYGIRELDDDNLASAFKAVRDGVADVIGLDDGDKRLSWQYKQEHARIKSIGIEINYK